MFDIQFIKPGFLPILKFNQALIFLARDRHHGRRPRFSLTTSLVRAVSINLPNRCFASRAATDFMAASLFGQQ